ncbi:MAG: YjgN family protein [Beijerinckiaceae bacterium]
MSDTVVQNDNAAPFVVQPSIAEPAGHNVKTKGDDLSPLVWRGLILTIVSLGFYRFWYRTDLRRWYWRNTIVGNHALEYRGTARELFIGFLIALAVVLPLYFSGSLIALFASENLGNVVSALSGLIFLVLVQYGAYRSRRYRLTRTFWRGVSFDQRGSGWRYAAISIFWFALTVISLGLMFPLFRRALERYRINTTWFGSEQGSFDAPLWPVMKRWLVVWFLCLVMFGYSFTSIPGVWTPVAMGGTREMAVLPFLILVLAVFLPFLLWPFYRAAEFRAFTNATRLGAVRFESKLSTRAYYFVFLKTIVVFILLLICLFFVAMGALAAFATLIWLTVGSVDLSSRIANANSIIITGCAILAYLSVFLMFSYAKETFLNQRFWRHAAVTLTILNLQTADNILAQSIADESATGEGLADAFDFGGV